METKSTSGNKKYTFLFLFIFLLIFSVKSLAIEPEVVTPDSTIVSETEIENHESENKFNAGKLITEHIGDSHQWHLWGDHGHAVHVPLPVILWTDKGLEMFSSSRVEHHDDIYKGNHYSYKLHDEHIEIVDEFGVVNEEATAKIVDISITKNVFALLFSAALMLWMFLSVAKAYSNRQGKAPKGLQSFVERAFNYVHS